ncbi:MAG TPA: glycosyltransferase family 4 protein [Cytophagales bacterium]|nr:glycosyltransferase family 4 protein [Cytophagales bacterium]
MKVLIVQKIAGISGSENYLLNLMPALSERGVEVEFLGLFEERSKRSIEPLLEKLSALKVKFHLVAVGVYPSLKPLMDIRKLIKNGKFDLVHTNLIHADLFIVLTKILFLQKLKIVSGKHGFDENYTKQYGFTIKKGFKNFYVIIAKFCERFIDRSYCISKGILNVFEGLGISKKAKIDLIYYGFDFNHQIFPSFSLRKTSKQLLIVGRLVPYKGHEFAIRAMTSVISKHKEANLTIVGGGAYEMYLKKLVKELNLEKYVSFEGHQSNVIEYIYNSDILIVPSIAEGFGIVFLEAFSQKKPVVAFDVPAANEIIEPDLSGILVKPYEVEALANSLVSLLESPEKMKAYGERGFSMLASYYNLSRMVNETVAFYGKAIEN